MNESRSVLFPVILLLVSAILPAMLITSAFDNTPPPLWLAVALGSPGGALAGSILAKDLGGRRGFGALVAVAGAIAMSALWYDIRPLMIRLEFALTIIVGAVPGILILVLSKNE